MASAIEITLLSSPDSVCSVALDGQSYNIRMQWLQSVGLWKFTLSTSSDDVLATSCVTPNSNLVFPVARADLPSGDFFVFKQADGALTYEDIAGGDAKLIYVGV